MDMRSSKYPYRLDVETRLPNGCITTHGYAAHHPAEFRHWAHARGYVLWGERIDDLIDFDRAAFLEAILPPAEQMTGDSENEEEGAEQE